MRLKNMYFTCKKNISTLRNIQYADETTRDGLKNRRIANYTEVNATFNELLNVACLSPHVLEIKNITNSHPGSFFIYEAHKTQYNQALAELILCTQTLIDLGDSAGFQSYEYGFDIKLPPDLSFSDMSKCMSDIDKILTQCPYLQNEDEKIEFKNVDVGSTWLAFITACTGGMVLLQNLAKIIDKAVQIASNTKVLNMQKAQLAALNLKNETAQGMLDAHKEIQKSLVDKCVSELSSEISPLDNESMERAKLSLTLLGDWMSKGMEIYSCVEAPDEIKSLFPSEATQLSLPAQPELLTAENSNP